jgi:hypothetical protein
MGSCCVAVSEFYNRERPPRLSCMRVYSLHHAKKHAKARNPNSTNVAIMLRSVPKRNPNATMVTSVNKAKLWPFPSNFSYIPTRLDFGRVYYVSM